jgi:putative flippase GtrA
MRQRYLTPEVVSFLTVGGTGYVVDVGAFNVLRSMPVIAVLDPSVAKVLAVLLAMVVTYVGNSAVTWRGESANSRRREIALFIMFNAIGLGLSVATLALSHDMLGLTSRLSDNISANVVGLGLGTAFRFWSYRRFVFDRSGAFESGRRDSNSQHSAWKGLTAHIAYALERQKFSSPFQ